MRSAIALSLGLLLCAPLGARAQTLSGPAATARPVGSSRSIVQTALASVAAEAAGQSADWQERYADAQGKRRNGVLWMLAGGGAAAVGTLLVVNVEEECSAFVCTLDYRLPVAVASSGAGLFTLGVIQFRDGGRILRQLEAQRGVTGARPVSSVYAAAASAVAGPAMSLTHTIGW